MGLLKRNTGGGSSFSPCKPITLPGGVLWILAAYVIVDLGLHMSGADHKQIHTQVIQGLHNLGSGSGSGEDELHDSGSLSIVDLESSTQCDSVEAHMEVFEDSSRKPQDPWSQLKWGLPPAECPVNGHLIERLDPLNNYRRGVALGFTTDLDDKTQIEQWFLGTKVDLNKPKRRVFIDLGANLFTTSILWFSTRYPCDFTEIYAFETDPTLLKLPAGWNEDQNWVEPERHGWAKIKSRAQYVPSWLVERIKTYTKFAGNEDNISSVNITRFIKDELKLKPEDTVIVKMDIEGAEWPILYQWVKDPDMPKIIDELFVELHYWHPDNNWESVRHWSREDATRMLADLRHRGFYAHYWD